MRTILNLIVSSLCLFTTDTYTLTILIVILVLLNVNNFVNNFIK